MEKFILKLVVDNTKGVMARIATLLARKGYNISSIAVGKHLNEGEASIILAIYGDEAEVEIAKSTLGKLVNVISIEMRHKSEVAEREHCLLKIRAAEGIEKKLGGFEFRVLQNGNGFAVVELVDYPARVDEFLELANRELEVIDVSRAGTNAI